MFQLNLLALTPHYGQNVQKTALRLLKAGLYDFVGSDVHHQRHLELLPAIARKKRGVFAIFTRHHTVTTAHV